MEHLEEPENFKKCYKLEHELVENLNVFYNTANSLIVLWNRFQIFIYEDLNFENTSKIFVPEFQVHQLIMSSNYLICLDNSGNVHTSSLKFKNPAQKRFKSSFQPRLQNVLVCHQIQESILSLKYDNDSYLLCLNKINADFQLENKVKLKYNGRWPLPQPAQHKCLLTSYKITVLEKEFVSKLFDKQTVITSDYHLIVMSFDKLNVYGCLFNPKGGDDDIILIKLYTCPSEICNIEVVSHSDLHILIGLKIGTLLRLSLRNSTSKPDIIHLNTALYKYLTFQETIIYTDGRSMWKAENMYNENIVFCQFITRHVKDLIRLGDQIICTTFSNIIYVYPIDDDSSFVKAETAEEYCAAEKLLNNSEYLYKIMEEVETNNELTKKINNEGNYITAFSLSKRQDVMANIIQNSVTVFERYEDVIRENSDVTLTENMYEYFKPNSFYFLVILTAVSLHHIFNSILSNVYNDVKIHITFSTDTKLLKTTSIKVIEAFKKMKVLLPFDFKDEDIAEINVNIKLVTSIPGAFDGRQKLWVTLFRKHLVLKSEHFIKPTLTNKNCFTLKDPIEPLVEVIYKTAVSQYGALFNITDISKYHSNANQYYVYGRLPLDYKNIFLNESLIAPMKHLNSKKITFLLEQIKSEEFLKSESSIRLQVGNADVRLDIINDEFTNPLLRVTSMNMVVAYHIRNFITNLLYHDMANSTRGFVNFSLYSTTEAVKKEVKICMLNRNRYNQFHLLAERFEKNVFGTLPI